MKTVIISAPRTGSTSLFEKLVKERKVPGYFNPWDKISDPSDINWDLKSFILKCGIIYSPIENGPSIHQTDYRKRKVDWFENLAKKFDEVIILSRKDTFAHVESYIHLITKNTPEGFEKNKRGVKRVFNSKSQYVFDPSAYSDEIKDRALMEINHMNTELRMLSKRLKIPLQYYEDWFDPNSKGRYRRERDSKLI